MARAWLSLVAVFAPHWASAAPEEIQVYLDDKEAAGKHSIDWHNIYVASGRTGPAYQGEIPPAGMYRLTPEFNLGLTETLELGFYWLTHHANQGGWQSDGAKARIKYIAPHAEEQGLFWGLNLELGQSSLSVEPYPWNAELKTIVGWHGGPWTLGGNFNMARPLARNAPPASAALDLKLSYALTSSTRLGLESFNELGLLRRPSLTGPGSRSLFASLDTEIAGHELNAGIGRGLSSDADRWVLKLILNTPFF